MLTVFSYLGDNIIGHPVADDYLHSLLVVPACSLANAEVLHVLTVEAPSESPAPVPIKASRNLDFRTSSSIGLKTQSH
jgi:hypothetical protein